MKKQHIPLIITYGLTHTILFAAWVQLAHAGLFAEEISIANSLSIVTGVALAAIQCIAIVRDIEYTLDNN